MNKGARRVFLFGWDDNEDIILTLQMKLSFLGSMARGSWRGNPMMRFNLRRHNQHSTQGEPVTTGLWLAAFVLAVLAAAQVWVCSGCGAARQTAPPTEVEATVRALTGELCGKPRDPSFPFCDVYHAAIELGEIGMKYRLPDETLRALEEASKDDSLAKGYHDFFFIGSGESVYRRGDGAHIAYLMWQLRDAATDTDRMRLLWARLADPKEGNAITEFCVDEICKVKSADVIPYLSAAASISPNWYVRRQAALRLGDFYQEALPLITLLAHSPDEAVAEISRRNLGRKGMPLPIFKGMPLMPLKEGEAIPPWPRALE